MRLSIVLVCALAGCDPAPEPPEARAVVDRLASRTWRGGRSLLPAAVAEKLVPEGAWLEPRFSAAVERTATVHLPRRASSPFRVSDARSPLSVEVTLLGAADAPAEIARGQVVYRDALDDAHVVQRPTPHGTEDYIELLRAPETPVVRYGIELGEAVAGLRQVENTLELLDAGGAPRLRMAEPLLLGSDGKLHRPRVEVLGCAIDRSAAPPWGRPTTPPGARLCTVSIDWRGESVSYPAVLDPTWTTPINMVRYRSGHTATVLPGGAVLLVGGDDVDGRGAEIYYNGAFTPAESMTYPRWGHTATLTSSGHFGTVLVVGGNLTAGNAESFSGLTGYWSAAGILSPPRSYHSALIVGGKLVIAGGKDASNNYLSNVNTYTLSTGAWGTSPPLLDARAFHTASRLPNGQILVAGGIGTGGALATTQQSAPDTSGVLQWSWAPTLASGPRSNHSAVTLGDGSILVAGGYSSCATGKGGSGGCTYPRGSERFVNGAWTAAGNLANGGRSDAALVALDGTRAVLTGGRVILAPPMVLGPLAKVDLFDGSGWHSIAPMHSGRYGHSGTRLSDGRVLVAGGWGGTAELMALDATGTPCTRGSDCSTGWCKDGVCCNGQCSGACSACSVAAGASADGVCAQLAAGAAGNPSCQPYLCQSGADCPTSCTLHTQCSPGNYCGGSVCTPKHADGAACASSFECTNGSCVDGFCCDAACGGSCTACSIARGSTQNGHCANVTGPGRTSCAPYACDGTGPNCPTSCGANMKFCNALNRCVPNTFCCADSECSSPPDTCHQSAGACLAGACVYSIVDCGVGVCSGGACASGPLTLTVAPVSPTASWSQDMFADGTVKYTATLTNVSTAALSVSPSAFGNIGVAGFTRNGVAVPLRISDYDYVTTHVFERLLTTLLPGASLQFTLTSVSGTDLTLGRPRLTQEFLADGPGSFRARFYYQYTGDNQGRTDVARGVVSAAEALVTVQ